MTITVWWLLALAGVFAAADWYAVRVRDKVVEYVCKPATLAVLVAVAVVIDPADETQRRWFVAALVLALIGDVFLMLPDRFVPGLLAFLGAHLAYIAGLAPRTGPFPEAWAGAIGVVVIGGVFLWIVLPYVAAKAPRLVPPVAVYAVVISVMLACAGATLNPLAAAGALLFYASDGLIAWTRFVGPVSWAPLMIISTYHVGQALLVVSLAVGWR